MEWQELKGGFSMATVKGEDSIDRAMIEFCDRIRTTVIPGNDSVGWDHLRVELWADSGRIIVFPASTKKVDRIEKAGCQVVFSALLARYESLADSDLEDHEFTQQLLAEEQRWIGRFMTAARSTGLDGHRLVFCDGADKQPISDQII